ncbi:MAG: exodeoxyribonuclease V subunit beta [Rhodocyclaceae bacterium]|nr:exodeoxyribonuclease V subunit beta [Rhodocyclaceae bacterium]
MNAPVQPLDPLAFPLAGSRLIEASAGTGKTFTIAALYLRLVLGHGDEAAHARPLTPPEILVVTFTEAATAELRERIRARLAEAACCFRDGAGGDPLLAALRDGYPSEQWPGCARRLQLAAEWMDEAAVSTIHGWCQRMLREHAFDSGSLFSLSLEADQSEARAEAVRDYWRSFLAPLDAASAAEVAAWWPGPAELVQALGTPMAHVDLLGAAPPPAEALADARARRAAHLAELKAPWADWADALQALFDEAVAAREVDGRKFRPQYYLPWLQNLRDWTADPAIVMPALSDTAWARLSPDGMAEAWKQAQPPAHPALDALRGLPDAIAALPEARADLLRHAAPWVLARFEADNRRRAQMGFDDLILRLDQALAGPNGAALAARIRRDFPVALIDEFQDTDPAQYRIFDAVYRVADNDPATALVLIGDPKQAIYSFRGADIHTYLVARAACAGRLYSLARNFRSSEGMVAAVNRCFAQAEARVAEGAFLFREADGNPLPFEPVAAQGLAEGLVLDGRPATALTLWRLDDAGDEGATVGKGDYRQRMAAACAGEMLRLLEAGQREAAGFARDGRLRPLRPADLAVLVNDRGEADAIRGALAARGLRSVYLSERESVFATPQAADLALWLAACAEPDDPRRLRAALATATLGLGYAELAALQADELAWEARVLQFRDYRACWRQQGVLPMLRRLMHDFGLPPRLIATGARGGERALTDLLHLAELLQQAAQTLDGEHALIRHLAEQMAEGRAAGDTGQLRLESDADLVQVVTVHKSKGLEYPLVFLPFACHWRPVEAKHLPLAGRSAMGEPRVWFEADADALRMLDRERLAEDVRKLYVALTRARHATWVGLAPVKGLAATAPGHLLAGGEAIAPDELPARLAALAGDCPHICVVEAPSPADGHYSAADAGAPAGRARTPQRRRPEPWWIASYSAIAAAGEGARAAADSPGEETLREGDVAPPAVAAERVAPRAGSPHAFPRGARPGSFLHEILEWAARQGFATLQARPQALRDAIARRCQPRGWAEWIDPLCDWTLALLAAPLPLDDGPPATLAGLPAALPEMEFWIEAHGVDVAAVDALVRAHTAGGAPRPALAPQRLHGMLKGFIDLVFEWQGRYYVADYKSNWLGPDDLAYTASAMQDAILHARYDLQYALYLLALHRLLKARLPDYDYDRHVGGAAYLFLRGVGADSRGLHRERPPRALVEGLDALFAGQKAEAGR